MKVLDEPIASGEVALKQPWEAASTPTVESHTDAECEAEVDRVGESKWSQLMEGFADSNIYQTWSYGAARWGQKSLSHLVLKRGNETAGLAQLRIVGLTGLKAGIAYLRWGPLCHRRGEDLDSATVTQMARALRREYTEKRGLYLEILPNAFCDSSRAQVFESAFTQFDRGAGFSAEQYRTFVLDLSPSLNDLRKNLDKKWRNQLNAAERNSLTIVEGNNHEIYRTFRKLYRQMWQRKRFHTSVDLEDFEKIQAGLPEAHKLKTLICEHEGTPVAGLVCSAIGESAIYLLGATNDQGMKTKSSYLLQWTLIRRLKEIGIRYYDLGGIDPDANPGVHHFKSGLSGTDLSHITPITACDSKLSVAAVETGKLLRNCFRRVEQRFARA